MFGSQLKKDFRNRRIRRDKTEIEPQEIFLDAISQKREEELGISGQRFEIPLSRNIFRATFLAFFLMILFLFGLTFRLQVLEGKKYSALADDESQRIYYSRAMRGVIYDRNLKQLVWNRPSFDLVADIRDISKNKEIYINNIEYISKIIGQPTSEIQAKIKHARNNKVLIDENISHNKLILLKTKIDSGNLPGFQLERNITRSYSDTRSLSHLIGYMGRLNQDDLNKFKDYSFTDYIGKTGIERSYERILRGSPGKLLVEKDALGRERKKVVLSQPKDGESLILSLDSDFQKKVESELKKELKVLGCKKAAAVSIDPNTGDILASVSVPGFDANLFSQKIKESDYQKIINNPQKPLFNRVVDGLYPTGSSIKPFIASAALQENIINEKTRLYCPLRLCLENVYTHKRECFPDWKYHGWTDVRRAIAESVNPFFYMIGGGYIRPGFADKRLPESFNGLGVEKIKKYLSLFGFGRKTGIDLPREANGRIPNPEWKREYFSNKGNNKWHRGDTYNLSIGQGYFLATPLQLVTAAQVIANGGTLYKPHLVKEIINDKKQVIKKYRPKIVRKDFIDKNNLKIVREGMRQAVTSSSGSAHSVLGNLPFTTAAKTGTAQIPGKDLFDNWVTVFAPYDNPKIILTVVIEDVKGMRSAALPVARESLKWYMNKYGNK